jgi:hypothetical protein
VGTKERIEKENRGGTEGVGKNQNEKKVLA